MDLNARLNAVLFSGPHSVEVQHLNAPLSIDETFRALFNRPPAHVMGGLTPVTSASPTLEIQQTDAGNVDRNSVFIYDGQSYKVAEKKEAENGIIEIRLKV